MNQNKKDDYVVDPENPEGELIIEHDINQAAQNIINEVPDVPLPTEHTSVSEEVPPDAQENTFSVNKQTQVPAAESVNTTPTYDLPENNIMPNAQPAAPEAQPLLLPHQKKQKLGLKIVLVAIICLILIICITVATYAMVYVPNKPNNIVKKSAVNMFEGGYYSAVKAKLTMQSEGELTELNTTAGSKGDIARADFGIKYAVFNLEGSALYNSKDKTAYVKINGLDKLANQLIGSANSLKATNKWMKLSEQSISSATGNGTDLKCFQGLIEFAKTDEFKNNIIKIYADNEFINATKVGSDKIEDQKAGKYKIAIDNAKGKQFAEKIKNSKLINDKLASIDPNCVKNTGNSSSEKILAAESKIENFYVWVNSKKQIVQASVDISSASKNRATLQLTMLEKNELDFRVPTDTVDGFSQLLANPTTGFGGL